MSDTDLPDVDPGPFRDVIRRATKRFKRAMAWESTARQRWLDDYRFANGDELNNYQWATAVYNDRNQPGAERPTLTINKVRVHNLLIRNDAKQNRSGIKYRPTGGGATQEAAELYEGITRRIQNTSHAQDAQGVAIDFQVDAGLGYTRIVTDYVDSNSFDQEIYIRPINDVMSCIIDPDHEQKDGSDARWGCIFTDRPRDVAEEKYPWLKGRGAPSNVIDGDDAGWIRDDYVREAEYYEMSDEQDELLGSPDGTTILRSEVPADMVKRWEGELEAEGKTLMRRSVTRNSVHWYKIIGDRVVDDAPWPGSTIPIVQWIGEETIIDQQLDRKGHTRAMRSQQRMLNYNRSASVEFGALQSKTPYLTAVDAIEGVETYWASANTVNHAYLPWNHRDDNGAEIPKPERQAPPQSAPVFMEGAAAAELDMMSASGQYQSELGAPGNEKSGRAINERQRQADRVTYHFVDNQAIAIRRQAEIILELIPKIYDTERVVRILAEDGTESDIQISREIPEAHGMSRDKITRILNPEVGKYEVVADVGPDYATQRQEAFQAIADILTQAPALVDKIGDLLFKVADFPLADEIAERLKPGLAPEAQVAIAELQKQLQHGNKMLGEALQALAEERLKSKGNAAESAIKAFEADTHRLNVVKDMLPLDPVALAALIRETVVQALQDNLGPVRLATAASLEREERGIAPPGASPHLPLPVADVGQQQAMVGGV